VHGTLAAGNRYHSALVSHITYGSEVRNFAPSGTGLSSYLADSFD